MVKILPLMAHMSQGKNLRLPGEKNPAHMKQRQWTFSAKEEARYLGSHGRLHLRQQ